MGDDEAPAGSGRRPVAASGGREILAVRYGHRMTTRAESYLNFPLYGEPDAGIGIDYFFWVIRDGTQVILVDTGFAPGAGDRRGRAHPVTPAQALPALGIDLATVTTIVITHAHWDHIGNIGQFPQAQLVMTEAEYRFWTSPLATRAHFAAHSEPDEIARLRQARQEDRLTLFQHQLALGPGVELIEVGGHTPGQLIVAAATATGTAVLASDALHFYEEAERDRPFAVLADLPALYRGYDLLNDLASEPGTHLVAGHDPLVGQRFAAHPAVPGVIDLSRPRLRAKFSLQSRTGRTSRSDWRSIGDASRRGGDIQFPVVVRGSKGRCGSGCQGGWAWKGPGRLSRQRSPCSCPTGRLWTEGAVRALFHST